MSVVVPNVWTNFEGTVTVDKVNDGDRWLFGSAHSAKLHEEHMQDRYRQDAERLKTVKNALSQATVNGEGRPVPLSRAQGFDANYCYWVPSPRPMGGFRGVPRVVNGEALVGAHPEMTDGPPAILGLLQSNELANKPTSVIADEARDLDKFVAHRWHDRNPKQPRP